MTNRSLDRVKQWRLKRAEQRTIARAVLQAAREVLGVVVPMRKANPDKNLIDMVSIQALSLWFTYAVIVESKAVKWLTFVLAVLSVVLIVLTAKLVLG